MMLEDLKIGDVFRFVEHFSHHDIGVIIPYNLAIEHTVCFFPKSGREFIWVFFSNETELFQIVPFLTESNVEIINDNTNQYRLVCLYCGNKIDIFGKEYIIKGQKEKFRYCPKCLR